MRMAVSLLLVAPTVLLLLGACSPNVGSGQAATTPWNRLALYRPGLVRISPGGGPVLSDVQRMPSAGRSSAPGGYRAPAPDFHLALDNDFKAAMAAEKAQNYGEALRLFRQIDTAPEVNVAYANVVLPDIYVVRPGERHKELAEDYADTLAAARESIGSIYESGLGVPRDYAEAAKWYQKALNTKDINGGETDIGFRVKKPLGLLYAYGLGVSRDRANARQLWVGMGEGSGSAKDLVKLLDNNALPETMGNRDTFWKEVALATARINEKEAQERAIAERQREKEEAAELAKYNREHPQAANPPGSGHSSPGNNCSYNDYRYAPSLMGGMVAGMYLGSGCH